MCVSERESVCVSLLDNHVLHRVCVSARLPRCTFTILEDVHLYILVYVYATCIHFFFQEQSVAVALHLCVSVCLRVSLFVAVCMYIYSERESFFFSLPVFFSPLPSHSNTRTFVRRRGTRASTLPPPKEAMRSCASSYTQAPKFPPKIR